MPVTEWDFVGRRSAGPVPEDVVAAITAALQAFMKGEEEAVAAARADSWGIAGRREAVGEGPFAARAELAALRQGARVR